MKRNTIVVLLGLSLAAFAITPTMAKTPDGRTPAEETVCDPLLADGVTNGLYGLCVAFCEAQDHAAETSPITETDLEALATAAPSGKILENYNKKKAETDPPMPCVVVEEPCPCWEADKLANARPPSMNEDLGFPNACFAESGFTLIENRESGSVNFQFRVRPDATCAVTNEGQDPNLPAPVVLPLTLEEEAACRASIIAHAQIWADPGRVWDCWLN